VTGPTDSPTDSPAGNLTSSPGGSPIPASGGLEVRGLGLRYGGVQALEGVTLRVPAGEVSGLIGPNGAGKTSFLDAVSGFAPPSEGAVVLDGRDATGLPPHRMARMGLTRTFQSLELFDDLTVEENLVVAATTPRWWSALRDVFGPGRPSPELTAALAEAMDTCGLGHLAGTLPAELSNGERHRVGLARALVARPSVLLLDEPAAGLDPSETDELADLLLGVAGRGTGVLLVDHDMNLVLGTCATVHVLDRGRLIASGTPGDIRTDPVVLEAYLGTPHGGTS
jgi:branched-chain amino acid transport system ATP-binding protein